MKEATRQSGGLFIFECGMGYPAFGERPSYEGCYSACYQPCLPYVKARTICRLAKRTNFYAKSHLDIKCAGRRRCDRGIRIL